MATEHQDPGASQREYRLGVLFVHGLGEQARGDTLTEMGDAVVTWLERTLENVPAIGKVQPHGARLRDVGDDDLGTAHMSVRVSLEEAQEPSDWLLAESWWADEFRQSSFAEFAAWGVAVGPWVSVTQFINLSSRLSTPRNLPIGIGFLVWVAAIGTLATLLVASLALSVFLTLLAVALTILRLIPVGIVQSIANALQRPLVGGFGDAFVLVRSPSRYAAMVERVRRDIGALLERCDEVVVVAHSQGTQIAWSAIRRPEIGIRAVPPRFVRFVTFGQAIGKLKLLYQLSHNQLNRDHLVNVGAGFVAQSSLVLIGVQLGAKFLFDVPELMPWALVAVIVLGFLAAELRLIYVGMKRWQAALSSLGEEISEVETSRWAWDDLWASADPFPNGPLVPGGTSHLASRRVRNLGSIFLDHSVYWTNLTEFVTSVARDLGQRAFPRHAPFASPEADRRHARAAMRRAARVHVRTALIVSWTLTAVSFIPVLAGIYGGTLADAVRQPLADAAQWFLVGGLVASLAPAVPMAIVVAIVAVVAYLIWSFVIQTAWSAGVSADDRAFFAGQDEGLFPWPTIFATGALAAILIAGPAVLLMFGRPLWYALPMVAVPVILITWVILSAGGQRIGQVDAPPAGVLAGSRWRIVALGLAILAVAGWRNVGGPDALVVVPAIAYVAILAGLAVAAVMVFRRFVAEFESRAAPRDGGASDAPQPPGGR